MKNTKAKINTNGKTTTIAFKISLVEKISVIFHQLSFNILKIISKIVLICIKKDHIVCKQCGKALLCISQIHYNMGGQLMSNWADDLIREYVEKRKELQKRADRIDRNNVFEANDLKHINGMIDSMTYAIEWLETGRQPDSYRGVDKKSIYQRQYLESMDFIPDITEQLENVNEKQLFMTSDEKEALSKIFASLSLRERQCFILHTGQKLSMSRIADIVGVSKSTVQKYINRAQMKVKEQIK